MNLLASNYKSLLLVTLNTAKFIFCVDSHNHTSTYFRYGTFKASNMQKRSIDTRGSFYYLHNELRMKYGRSVDIRLEDVNDEHNS